jgi:hypothetical protein
VSKVVGDIAVQVGADVSQLQAGMDKASRSVKGFDKNTARMAANVAKVGAAVAVAFAAVVAGTARLAASAATTAKEIQNLSNIVGVSAEAFQKSAQAARTVGIEQEKLADIFKDVNDKFGDFMATGAGPLADFFEQIAPQVGVTADQFARLSGPEALQLYVSSLEKAGLSQQQMTFYMEALASDATALIPLMRDNGRLMGELGDEAQRTGRILSNEAVAAGTALNGKLNEMATTLKTQLNQAILDNADDIIDLAETITEDWIPALISVAGFIGDVVGAVADMVTAISDGISKIVEFGGAVNDHMSQPTKGSRGRRGKGIGQDEGDGGAGSDFITSTLTSEQTIVGVPPVMPSAKDPEKDPVVIAERLVGATRVKDREKLLDDLDELERKAQEQRRRSVSGAFGDLSGLMQSENKKLFDIGKAAAIADATVSGYHAAVTAWDKGMSVGGPPVAAAFTAASLAKTGALVSSISSASSSGGGSAGGGGGAVSAAAAAPQASRDVTFQIVGSDNARYSRDDIVAIGQGLNELIEDGGSISGVRFV